MHYENGNAKTCTYANHMSSQCIKLYIIFQRNSCILSERTP